MLTGLRKQNEPRLRNPIPIFPQVWDTTQRHPNGEVHHLKRMQLPLALAWATTIHKAQGQTVDYATVDIRGCFTSGQAYVGLSRCRSPDSLQVLLGGKRLKDVFSVDYRVVEFYRGIDGSEAILGPLARSKLSHPH